MIRAKFLIPFGVFLIVLAFGLGYWNGTSAEPFMPEDGVAYIGGAGVLIAALGCLIYFVSNLFGMAKATAEHAATPEGKKRIENVIDAYEDVQKARAEYQKQKNDPLNIRDE